MERYDENRSNDNRSKLEQCSGYIGVLRVLERSNYPARIVVVDNGSTDDSVVLISRKFPTLTLLETHGNLGYTGGNNVGIGYALNLKSEFICILNNDVCVSPDFLSPLLAAFDNRPGVGVATPLVSDMNEPGMVWALGQAVNWRTGVVTRIHAGEAVAALRGIDPLRVDCASGAAMLVRRQVFERVGLLDEAFYLYFEETDWSLRVRHAGYAILAVLPLWSAIRCRHR